MRKSVATCALLLAVTAANAEWMDLTGKEAPSFAVEKWFNQPDGSSIADLRGKVILLEFWATW